MTRRISAASSGVTRSSASTAKTQSPAASASAALRWLAKSSKARTATTSASRRAIARVASRLAASTTTTTLVGPARRGQAIGEVVGLVPGDDQDRDPGLSAWRPPFLIAPARVRAGK